MPLKAVLETLEGVDDAVQSFYAEKDGVFILDVEGMDSHPEVRGVIGANQANAQKAKERQAKIEGLTAQIAELQKGAPDTAATQAKITALEEKLAAKEAEVGDWKGKYTGVTRDQSLSSALQGVGITEPAFVKAATAMLSSDVKLGEDGTAYVDTLMGPKVLGDYVKSWAASEGQAFVSKPQGGGAQSGTGAAKKTNPMFERVPALADLPEK